MKKKRDNRYIYVGFFVLVFFIIIVAGINLMKKPALEKSDDSEGVNSISDNRYIGKKILFVNSYHEGYEWSDGIERGAHNILDDTGVELKFFRMDTKRNTEEDFMKQKALEAKSFIEEFKPDVVITSDDNAFKYLIMPYYKDADLPVVFCGLNWDASVYGAPYNNTAGMVEIALINQMIEHLKPYSKGERIGYIAGDVLSAKKEAENYKTVLGLSLVEKYAKDFTEWKSMFKEMQEEVNILIIYNNAGIEGWDNEEAEKYVLENTEVPSGTINDWMMPYTLFGLTKPPEEQGEAAAKIALRILDGERPSEIPIEYNKKGELVLNLNIAEKLDIVFPPSLIKNAKSIIQ